MERMLYSQSICENDKGALCQDLTTVLAISIQAIQAIVNLGNPSVDTIRERATNQSK